MADDNITLTIDGREVTTRTGTSILKAAEQAGIYIPFLCTHPDLVSLGNCRLCIVKVGGMADLPLSCETEATQGMVVTTETPELQELRQESLAKILAEHPHACLDCWRRMSCKPSDTCLQEASVEETCVSCLKNKHCEFQRLVDYIGVDCDIPYNPKGHTVIRDNPFLERNDNLCVMCGRCVQICRDVRGVGVYAFDNEENPTQISTVKRGSIKDSGCKFCFACAEVCPTGAIMDVEWQKLLADREAYVVPCSSACPAGIDIPRYVNYVAQSKYSEALAVIREKVPFPGTLGRVCIHPCEQACRRNQLNDSISINELKRVAADRGGDLWREGSKITKRTGRRVAIVGAGPAGLTAAFYLAKAGHSVTVFEALPQPGGMMRIGIPEYRLPRNILASEIDVIRETGVEIKTNTRVESVDSLLKDGFNAVFIAVGAHQGIKMGCEGENLPGVINSVTFLRQVNLGEKVKAGDKVAVIGGGNAAIDAARMVLRTGVKEVTIIYRRTRTEMTAAPEEIEDALDEGIKIVFLAAPSRISKSNGKLLLECVRMELAEPDASGRARPVTTKGSEYTAEYDTIIAAIGQVPDIPEQFGLRTGRDNTIQVNPRSLKTNKGGVFAGGDAVSGAASVIEAIAMARQAASAIDKYLGGNGVIDETLAPVEQTSGYLGKDKEFADRRRLKTQLISRHERLKGFAEARPALTPEQARMEAGRCLRCDLRLKISPVMQAPQNIVTYTVTIEVVRPRSGRSHLTAKIVRPEQVGTRASH
ncbi:FAD-dependent oxidoreductase [Chloroflexota bacterium]